VNYGLKAHEIITVTIMIQLIIEDI